MAATLRKAGRRKKAAPGREEPTDDRRAKVAAAEEAAGGAPPAAEGLARPPSPEAGCCSDGSGSNPSDLDGPRPVIDCLEPTYLTGPGEDGRFRPARARRIIEDVLREELGRGGTEEDLRRAEDWSSFSDDMEGLAMLLTDRVRGECLEGLVDLSPRYKLVVHATVGQRRDQGATIASRCLWDAGTDGHASATYRTGHLWATCVVFALYTD